MPEQQPSPTQAPTIGRIVIFTEGELVAPAIVTKVETPMQGVVAAVSLAVFPPDELMVARKTVPHESTFEASQGSFPGFWAWPERV